MTLFPFPSLLRKTAIIAFASLSFVSATQVPSAPSVASTSAGGVGIETIAAQAILVDHHTGRVLFEKNADELMHPSSMTKLMTAYMLFKMIRDKVVAPETTVYVSQNAWKMGGSKMFLALDSAVSILDLLKGIIVQSGNDACIAAAEGTMGSEAVFASAMTQLAHDIGATQTTFKNASGWPDPEHLTTARDLCTILRRIIDDYPEHHDIFQIKEFVYNNIRQHNRNPLLYKGVPCDVGKTGFTDAGKYGLTASATENGLRVNMVINGLPSSAKRSEEAVKLMTWALKTFATQTIFKKGQLVETAPVWLGTEDTMPLTVLQDCVVTVPKVHVKDIKVEIQYNSPIEAPMAQNTEIGKIVITAPTLSGPIEVPLVTAVPLDKAGYWKRLVSSIKYLIWGKSA